MHVAAQNAKAILACLTILQHKAATDNSETLRPFEKQKKTCCAPALPPLPLIYFFDQLLVSVVALFQLLAGCYGIERLVVFDTSLVLNIVFVVFLVLNSLAGFVVADRCCNCSASLCGIAVARASFSPC